MAGGACGQGGVGPREQRHRAGWRLCQTRVPVSGIPPVGPVGATLNRSTERWASPALGVEFSLRKPGPLGKNKERALRRSSPFVLSYGNAGLQASKLKNVLWMRCEAMLKHSPGPGGVSITGAGAAGRKILGIDR